MNIRLNWAEFKTLIDNNIISWKYAENSILYFLYGAEGLFVYTCNIIKDGGTDQTDFETNYKSNAAARLKMDVNVETTVTVEQLRTSPRFYLSDTVVALSETEDTQLVSLDFDGKLDGISLSFNRDDVELVLIVDAVEIFRESLANLKSAATYYFDTNGIMLFPINVRNDGKQVAFKWDAPADVRQNFTVKAKALKSSTKMKAIAVAYRVKA